MNKIHLLIVAVIGLLVLSACQSQSGKDDGSDQLSPFTGGSKGIVANFLDMGVFNDETGIEEIFEGESFPIEVLLNNKGEEEVIVGDATVTLKGISLNQFTGIVANGELNNIETIEKVSEFNDVGGEVTLDFTPGSPDAVYQIPLSGSHYDVSVFAEVVYLYKTHALVPKVCFKEDLQDDRICDVDANKKVFSSAAPIQVTNVEEKRAGTGKVAVEFDVENIGSGDVAKPSTDFDSRFDELAFNSSDASEWECKSGGKLNEGRFDSDGKMKVVCKLITAMTEDTLYTKQLELTLIYQYKDLIQRQIRIREQ
ncbi:MAG TPA: hypothetical protein VJH97_04500 [Candidatus Nanoarchaeia archaeon]|nr:hypothetical protein [Candidatus Nanoarchaeia archaeon]